MTPCRPHRGDSKEITNAVLSLPSASGRFYPANEARNRRRNYPHPLRRDGCARPVHPSSVRGGRFQQRLSKPETIVCCPTSRTHSRRSTTGGPVENAQRLHGHASSDREGTRGRYHGRVYRNPVRERYGGRRKVARAWRRGGVGGSIR